MKFIPGLLERIGIYSDKWVSLLTIILTAAIAVAVACAVWFVIRNVLYKIFTILAQKTPTRWDNIMFDRKFFRRLGIFSVPIVLQIFAVSYLGDPAETTHIVVKLINVWITFAAVALLAAILEGANRIYEIYPTSRNRPIKVFVQLVVIFLYLAAIMVTIQIFTEKSMTVLLGGLAVFASVLLLVFKDTILGFVAGIQLMSNDMLHIGDWIEMPSAKADGDVIEVGLTTVKVQNWDKTITTIPTYNMVSQAFTNWRGMEQSGGRRIKRSVNIDVNSIRYLTDEDMERLKESSLLRDYIEQKQREIGEYNTGHPAKLDGRRLTNIGTFREYMESWLAHNPAINQAMTHMVRQLQPGPAGLPLEIYCFSARKAWIQYERVQSDLFDHFYAIMELFGLRAFQYPGTQLPRPTDPQQPFIPPAEEQ